MGDFQFKRFKIEQALCGMKVGTDGVLLGAWARGGSRVLDVGTGTGVIALMMAQRYPEAQVLGIDIDEGAVRQAAQNVEASPFARQIQIGQTRVQDMDDAQAGRYDAVVSNPPFFTGSLKAPDGRRSDARHSDTLSFRELASEAASMLSEEGRLAVVYPAEEAEILAGTALKTGLFPCRICRVSTKAGKAPKRVMMEFSMQKKEPLIEELFISDGEDYSEEYKALTRDFYIYF